MNKHSETHRYEDFGNQYANLGLTDTYYLGFRDIPLLIEQFNVQVGDALDHGCGSGRATRFLKQLGFKVIGVDRSADMLAHALTNDPSGEYRLVSATELTPVNDLQFDLIFQSSVLEEYSSTELMTATFNQLRSLLKPSGKIIIVTASEELPLGSWASFEYPNQKTELSSGEQVVCTVRGSDIIFKDYHWKDSDLRKAFNDSKLRVLTKHHPLATGNEPFHWRDETTRPAWSVYVLEKDLD